MFILRAMFSNHGASYTVREIISEFFQLELNVTYNICTPVTEGELYKKLCWEAQPQGLNPLPGFGSRPPCCIPLWQRTYPFRITDFPILWFAPTCEISILFIYPKAEKGPPPLPGNSFHRKYPNTPQASNLAPKMGHRHPAYEAG